MAWHAFCTLQINSKRTIDVGGFVLRLMACPGAVLFTLGSYQCTLHSKNPVTRGYHDQPLTAIIIQNLNLITPHD